MDRRDLKEGQEVYVKGRVIHTGDHLDIVLDEGSFIENAIVLHHKKPVMPQKERRERMGNLLRYRAWLPTLKWMCSVSAILFDEKSIDVYKIDDAERVTEMSVHQNEVVLMQSTGIKDKNGTEVFEGDVVVTNGWRRQVVTFGTQEVEEDFGSVRIYRGFNLYLGGGYPNAVMSTFEVIGNIYENPELMEADNDPE